MRTANLTSIVLLACCGGGWSLAAMVQAEPPAAKQESDEEQPLSFWMDKKMEYSQEMLRGLVRGELDEVAERAEQMRVLSRVEGWIRAKRPGYRAQLQVFEFANSEILRQSRAKNLEGTTMAFQQLTASCVSCHRSLRETNGNAHAVENKETAEKEKTAD